MTTLSSENCLKESFLPTAEEIQKQIPLYEAQAAFIQRSRKTIQAILKGLDPRRLLIVGPCSIHDCSSALEYGLRLREIADKVADQFFIVMRTYCEKARTLIGWKGMLYDPDLDGSYRIEKGIQQTRQLLSELTEMGVAVGCELLEINTAHYYIDFLSWGCIGARTSSSPIHRQFAATLDLPMGFKNSMDGNINQAIQGILAASKSHIYLGASPKGQMMRIQAPGNSFCHLVLRGGSSGPNYYPDDIRAAIQKCQQAKIREKIVVDCSHGNCGKVPRHQIKVFESLVDQILHGNRQIAGIMLESHLQEGTQEIKLPLRYGVSITDPCIDWNTTKDLILEAHISLQSKLRLV